MMMMMMITASASNMTLTKVKYHSLNYVKHRERTVAQGLLTAVSIYFDPNYVRLVE